MQSFQKGRERKNLWINGDRFFFKWIYKFPGVRFFLKGKLQYTGFNVAARAVKLCMRAISIFPFQNKIGVCCPTDTCGARDHVHRIIVFHFA